MTLTNYRTLGNSGLVVSPLALGTMTFGTARWGTDEEISRDVFNTYVDLGGNFIDTADVYSGGRSEEMIGGFIAERTLRDQIVVATKAGFCQRQGALQRRQQYQAHPCRPAWFAAPPADRLCRSFLDSCCGTRWTPAEELLETMAALIQAGKIRYWGISNAPAWFVAKVATLAVLNGKPKPVGLQYFYSLVSRDIENEHIPAATEFGMGIVPWSPLAYGLLAGKYNRATVEAAGPRAGGGLPRDAAVKGESRPAGDKRLDGANPFGDTLFTERNWKIVDVLQRVAGQIGQSPARVALSWVINRPGISSTLMGVSRVEQLADNAEALNIVLSSEHRAQLDAISGADPRTLLHSVHAGPASAGDIRWSERNALKRRICAG